MRSLRIVLALLGLLLGGSLLWLLVSGEAGDVVGPETDASTASREPDPIEPHRTEPAAEVPIRVEVDTRVAAERETDAGNLPASTRLIVLVRAEETEAPLTGCRVVVRPDPVEGGFSARHVRGSRGDLSTSPVTDSEGRVEFTLPPARAFQLVAEDPMNLVGPAHVRIEPLAPGETREIEVSAATESDVHFVARVIDNETNVPLAGAQVIIDTPEVLIREATGQSEGAPADHLQTRRALSTSGWGRIVTDGDGYFELDVRSWLGLMARIEAPGYSWGLVPITAGCESRETAQTVRLCRSAALDVHVTGPIEIPTGEAQVQITVPAYQLAHPNEIGLDAQLFHTVGWKGGTDGDSHVLFSGLPACVPLDVDVTLVHQNAMRRAGPVVLEPGENRKIEVVFGTGAVVAGSFRKLDGTPAEPAEIWMKRGVARWQFSFLDRDDVRATQSDADGHFVFENVPDGQWVIGPAPTGSVAPVTVTVTVESGLCDHEALLIARDDLYINGRVVGPDGRPCMAGVTAFCPAADVIADDMADDQGAFSLGPLVPGSYTLTAHQAGWTEPRLADSEDVIVEPGVVDVVLQLRAGASIAGRVVKEATGESVRCQLILSQARIQEKEDQALVQQESADGSFVFDGLVPGEYSLSATTRGGECGVLAGIQVSLGEQRSELILPVRLGGRLHVFYEGSSERAQILVLHNDVVVAIDSVEADTFEVLTLPAGLLEVVCVDNSEEGPQRVRWRRQPVSLVVGELGKVEFGPEED